MEIRRNNPIFTFWMKWLLFTIERICNCEMIPTHMTCSLKNPWRCPGVLCSNHTQTNYAPFSLSASIRFHPSLRKGVDISGGERETVTSAEVWSRSRSAGVDSGRSLRFLPKPDQDPESDFWLKTGPGAGAGARISVFTGVGY